MRIALSSIAILTLSAACAASRTGTDEATGESSGETDGSETASDVGTDTDTGGVCELPENATPSETATISIVNNRDVAIYVIPYSSFGCNYGQVEIEVDGAPVLWEHASTYAYDCSGPLCDFGCSDGGDSGLYINPGATAEIEWQGGVWTPTPLSDACKAELDCLNEPGPTCSALTIHEGEYLVRVNLADCPIEEECMACTDGVCEVFFYEPWPGAITESFTASATFPAGVEIVID